MSTPGPMRVRLCLSPERLAWQWPPELVQPELLRLAVVRSTRLREPRSGNGAAGVPGGPADRSRAAVGGGAGGQGRGRSSVGGSRAVPDSGAPRRARSRAAITRSAVGARAPGRSAALPGTLPPTGQARTRHQRPSLRARRRHPRRRETRAGRGRDSALSGPSQGAREVFEL